MTAMRKNHKKGRIYGRCLFTAALLSTLLYAEPLTVFASPDSNVTEITAWGPVDSLKGKISRSSENSAMSASIVTSPKNLASLSADSRTVTLSDSIHSDYAVVYDIDAGRILAEKRADAVISPASMTKIMTILVLSEKLSDPSKKLTITQDIVDYVTAHDASNCGFSAGESVSVRDLMYGVILPSGADAVMALARSAAGSEAGLAALMNQKGSALGLSSGAHFSNATGLYLADHHLTVKDQAEILNAALANPTARTCLTAKTWTTAADSQHPSGISFKNLFLTRIAEQDTGGVQVLAAKTGYVSQSGNCAASYGVSAGGRHLLVVTAHASGAWNCIYDHALLYKQFAS